MKNIFFRIKYIGLLILFSACQKAEFLNKKPINNILTPTTLTDFQRLLDNTNVMNLTGGLAQSSSDEYSVTDANWSTGYATERNSYIWAKDIYAGDVAIADWNTLYQQVFYANNVLEGLAKSDSSSAAQAQNLKGWALFARSYAFYDLTRTFCKAYDPATANSDLGIPLKLNPGIDNLEQRATLQKSFDQILNDLQISSTLLPAARPSSNLNRPSKIAAFALLARIYLDMRNYTQAELFSDQALNLYRELIDYNTVSLTGATPFSITNAELIYNSRQVISGTFAPTFNGSASRIPLSIINSYLSNDLRSSVFFARLSDGSYYKKRGYQGTGLYTFTGLATDELYLIKAECLARKGQTQTAMDMLNSLLVKRFRTNTYLPLLANTPNEALQIILQERRKELVWRNLRWFDLKRLNKETAGITLTRTLRGVTYTLTPNDDRWVMPIPNDEIALSQIQQNPGR